MPDNVVNLILLGSDQRPYEGGHRTDTMSILSLDPNNGKATLISIPRDLYVYIPGWRVDRINTAQGDASRFNQIYAEYKQSEDVTRRRMYLEGLGKVLPKIEKKYIVDDNVKGLLPLMQIGEE